MAFSVSFGRAWRLVLVLTLSVVFAGSLLADDGGVDYSRLQAERSAVLAEYRAARTAVARGGANISRAGLEQRLARELFAIDSQDNGPHQIDAELIEEGVCAEPPCRSGILSSFMSGERDQYPPVRAPSVISANDQQQFLFVTWASPPWRGPGFGFQTVEFYDVLIRDLGTSRYWLYRVTARVPLRSPLGRSGAHWTQSGPRSTPELLQERGFTNNGLNKVRQSLRFPSEPGAELVISVKSTMTSAAGQRGTVGGVPLEVAEDPSTWRPGPDMQVGDVQFLDRALEQCVLEQYGSKELVSSVSVLNCSTKGIQLLGGLEYFTALRDLALANNQISSLDALTNLSALETLNISGTKVGGLESLSSLQQLKRIYLNNTTIPSLLPLTSLNNLVEIHAGNSAVTQIHNLQGTALEVLDLTNNPLTDISGLASVFSLREVYLSNNRRESTDNQLFGDLTPLINLAQNTSNVLQVVDLSPHPGLYCFHIQVLQGILGNIVDAPANCLSIPIPSNLGSTNNPSQSNDFSLAWEAEGVLDSSVFEIEEKYLDSNGGQVLSATRTNYDFSTTEEKPPGLIGYRVRHCDPESRMCSGWSLTAWQTVVGSANIPAEAALFDIGDYDLRDCLAEQVYAAPSRHGSEMLTGELQAMYCDGRNIDDLTNVGLFPNISIIHLSRNNIDNITPLAPLFSNGTRDTDGQRSNYDLRLADNLLTSQSLVDLRLPPTHFSTLDLSRNSLTQLDGLNSVIIVKNLYLSENEIASLNPLQGALLVRLFAEQNNLTQMSDLEVSHTLRLNNNDISDFGLLQQLPATLQNLSLSANPIAADASHQQILSSATDLKHLALDGTGITSVDFLESLYDIETLSVRENQIGNIGISSTLLNLRELWASSNPITSIAPLVQLPALELLDLKNTQLVSIPDFHASSILSDLTITHGELSAFDALDGFIDAKSLERLTLAENQITDISGIVMLLLNPNGNASLGQGEYPNVFVDLSGEPQISCNQIAVAISEAPERIWHNEAYPRKCLPDAPIVTAQTDNTRNRLGLSWPPIELPEGYDGIQAVEAQYKLSQQSEFGASSMLEHSAGAAVINVDPPVLDFYEVRMRSCRQDGECSAWSNPVASAHSLVRPSNVNLVEQGNGDILVDWSYPRLPEDDVPDIFFVVSDQFARVENIVLPQLSATEYASTIPEAQTSQYPGGIIRIKSCEGDPASPERICGPSGEARIPQEQLDLTLPAPTQVQLERHMDSGNELNTYTLSWNVADDERIDYFRVEERIPGTLGRSGESTLVAANAFETQSVTLHREVGRENTEFQVYACTRDLERHQDACSEAGSVIQGTKSSGIGYLGDAYGYCWESEDDLVPGSNSLGSYAKIDLNLYWRHGYAGQATAYPTDFEVSRRPWTNIVSSSLGYSQSRMRRIQLSLGVVEYESFWKVGITGFTVYNPEPGENDYSEKLAVRPKTPDRVGSWGQSLFSPILVVEDEFVMDESTRCDFQSPGNDMFPLPDSQGRSVGGPGALSPGHWITTLPLKAPNCLQDMPGQSGTPEWENWADQCIQPSTGPRTGWQFYWTSALREEEHDDPTVNSTFGKSYDLIGFWQTYRKFDNQWSPVWYYTRMQARESEGETFAQGALMYPTGPGQPDTDVGKVRVAFGENNRQALLTVDINDNGGLVGDVTMEIRDFILDELVWSDGADDETNPTDHFNGIWAVGSTSGGLIGDTNGILESGEFFVSEWTVDRMTNHGVFGFDNTGRPIWLVAYLCSQEFYGGACPGGMPNAGGLMSFSGDEYSFAYNGVDPLNTYSDSSSDPWSGYEYLLAADSVQINQATSGGRFARSYEGTDPLNAWQDRRTGNACINLSSQTNRGFFALSTGGSCSTSPMPMAPMRKLANNHFVDYELYTLESGGQCVVSDSGFCRIDLTWFTDADYPQAELRIVNEGSGELIATDSFCAGGMGPAEYSDEYSHYRSDCLISAPGNYIFHLVARPGQAAEAVIAESRVLEVTDGTLPDDPVVSPPLVPIPDFRTGNWETKRLESSSVGAISGSFQVDPSGAANYSIPIMTAVARGGFAPEITLNYNHRSGQGSMGTGWAIGGLSGIQRCDQGVEFGDDSNLGISLTSEDRFCLDGQRLLLVGESTYGGLNSEYRLESNPMIRVTIVAVENANPSEFMVELPGGAISWYGSANSGHSARVEVGPDNRIHMWPVRLEEDSFGNQIEYTYWQPGRSGSETLWVEVLIDEILYNQESAQPASSKLKFWYEAVPSVSQFNGFVAGVRENITQRLGSIQSMDIVNPNDPTSGSEDLRAYFFEYDDDVIVAPALYPAEPVHSGQFVLDAVIECSAYTAGSTCLPPTKFGWREHLEAKFGAVRAARNEGGFPIDLDADFPSASPHSIYPVDITGNGRSDLVVALKRFNIIELIAFTITDELGFVKVAGSHNVHCWDDEDPNFSLSAIDFDGNGRHALLYPYTCSSGNTAVRSVSFLENHNGEWTFVAGSELGGDLPIQERMHVPMLSASDFNGDTVPDLIIWDGDENFGESTSKPIAVVSGIWANGRVSYGDAVSFSIEVSRDECSPFDTDCEYLGSRARIHKTGPFGIGFDGSSAFLIENTYQYCDNDDPIPLSRSDQGRFLPVYTEENCYKVSFSAVYTIASGEGGFTITEGQQIPGLDTDDRVFMADVNRDGAMDLVRIDESDGFGVVRVHEGNGIRFLPGRIVLSIPWFTDGPFNRFGTIRLMDINGDGSVELMYPSDAEYDNAHWEAHAWDFSTNTFRSQSMYQAIPAGVDYAALRTGAVWLNDKDAFLDLKGDGRPDRFLITEWNPGQAQAGGECLERGKWKLCYSINTTTPAHFAQPSLVIDSIVTGLDHKTEIVYASLQDEAVYQSDVGTPVSDWGNGSLVYNLRSPVFVVRSVEQSNPSVTPAMEPGSPIMEDEKTRLEYFYAGAKVQAGKRGLLGFRQMGIYDTDSQYTTVTTYRQDFPHIGQVESKKLSISLDHPWTQFSSLDDPGCSPMLCLPDIQPPDAILLSETFNSWDVFESDALLDYSVQTASIEHHYFVHEEQAGTPVSIRTHTVQTTHSDLTNFGKAQIVETVTKDSNSEIRHYQRSERAFESELTPGWVVDRVICSTSSSRKYDQFGSLIDEQPHTVNSAFKYQGRSSAISEEILLSDDLEMDLGNCSNYQNTSNFLTRDIISFDLYGNPSETEKQWIEVTDDLVHSRREKVDYIDGRHASKNHAWIEAGWVLVKEVEEFDRFGQAQVTRLGNGTRQFTIYDELGRSFATWDESVAEVPSGAWSAQWVSSVNLAGCPDATSFKTVSRQAGGSEAQSCQDILGREIRSRQLGFEGGWVHVDQQYDFAGRMMYQSTPYFEGSDTFWTQTYFDQLGRPISSFSPSEQGDYHELLYSYTYEVIPEPTGHPELITIRTVEEKWVDFDGGLKTRSREVKSNVFGEEIERTNFDQSSTTFQYDVMGRVKVTDGPLNGNSDEITIDYDYFGNKKKVVDPDMGTWHYLHNSVGELLCQVDAEGNGIVFEYDSLGRLVRRDEYQGVAVSDLMELTNCDFSGSTHEAATTWIFDPIPGGSSFGQLVSQIHSDYSNRQSVCSAPIGQSNFSETLGFDYDDWARPVQTTTKLRCGNNEREFVERWRYDGVGRLFQKFDARSDFVEDTWEYLYDVGGRGERYTYNDFGYRDAVYDARYGIEAGPLYVIDNTDALGNVVLATAKNGMVYRSRYDRATGALLDRYDSADRALGEEVAQLSVATWDAGGRLRLRSNFGFGYSDGVASTPHHEYFAYDTRDRLVETRYTINELDDLATWDRPQSLRYDSSGNILCKSDVHWPMASQVPCEQSQLYLYGDGITQGAGPHALREVNANGVTRTFDYDKTGNLENDGMREYSYNTARRMAHSIRNSGADRVDYFYGGGREKRLKAQQTDEGLIYTFYVGDVQVEVANTPGAVVNKYEKHLEGIALVTEYPATGIVRTLFKHVDHQGSLVALSDENGSVEARMSFDAWGNRRSLDTQGWGQWLQWTESAPSAWNSEFMAMLAWTDRGYTGHEHIDALGLIHMNGRIYDPHLGRFLQSDPFVEDVGTLNRYTYVHNNPLGWVDPSGFTGQPNNTRGRGGYALRQFRAGVIGVATMGISTGLIAAKYVEAGIIVGAAGAATAAYVATGSMKSAYISGVTAIAFFGAGQHLEKAGRFKQMAVHGLIGGASAAASGGDFSRGFMAASFTKLVSPGIQNMPVDDMSQLVIAGVVSGLASEISGGQFALAAIRGAMGYAFNQATQPELQASIPDEIRVEEQGFLTAIEAARAYARRYFGPMMSNRQEPQGAIVLIGPKNWGYLTPGWGATDNTEVHIDLLMEAYLDAGYAPKAWIHGHFDHQQNFSALDFEMVWGRPDNPLYLINSGGELRVLWDSHLQEALDGPISRSSLPKNLKGLQRYYDRSGLPGDVL